MSFAHPWWLLGLSLVPLLWLITRSGTGAVPDKQRRAATLVRSVLVVALVLALSGAALSLPERRLATVFLVDLSDSISGSGMEQTRDFLVKAVESKPKDALAGVVAFAREARVELSVRDDITIGPLATRLDASRTDLARALRLGAALLPEGTRRRVVVLSDGRQNSGDASGEAARLRGQGIAVDTVALGSSSGNDSAILGIKSPNRVRSGEEFDIEVEIAGVPGQTGRLRLLRDDVLIHERDVIFEESAERVSILDQAGEPGAIGYRAEIRSSEDPTPQNDSASALVLVSGPPRVIIVEGGDGEGEAIEKALSDRGFRTDRRGVSGFPAAAELSTIDTIVLVDVPASSLTATQTATLAAFVRDIGKGMLVVGGESSWSLGGYRDTPLEDLLPLSSEIKDPKRRFSVAQALVIDTSGSMAQCHCAEPGAAPGGGMDSGGPNKTDISRSAAAKAIEALSKEDEIGVLAFNTESKWVIPLQRLPAEEVIRNGLQRLQPQGGTAIPQAIQTAVEELKNSKAALRHIILFTDGWTNQQALAPAAKAIREQGITISVVATGEGTGTELARMAEEGGGRFYAGRNLLQIPEIFMNEVVLASRRYVNEGEFFPKVTGSSPSTDRLVEAPALLGYVGTSAKPSSSVLLSVGELDDPLLATWRTGLGVVSAWTSDAKGRWANRWISWQGFAEFWSDVVRETLPASPAPGYSTVARASDDGIEITVESEHVLAEGTSADLRLVGPDGNASKVEMRRSGTNSFSASTPAGAAGAYLASVELSAGGAVLYRDTAGAVQSYSAEYRPGRPDEALLKEVARVGGGRFAVAPSDVFDPNLPAGRRTIEIWPWLVGLAALLLPIDVALRRLLISREDLQRFTWRRRGRTVEAVPDASVGRLLEAKDRVRRAGPRG